MPTLIPVDPNSQVAKDLMAVDAANTQPDKAGTRRLVPVDPASADYKAIMTGSDLADRQEAARPGAQPNEARVQQVHGELKAARPKLWMEEHGLPRPPGAEAMSKFGPAVGQFALGMTPVGRTAQMGFGGVLGAMEPAETIGERITNAAVGAVTPLVGEYAGKALKGGLKLAGQTFGGKAIPKAAGAVMDEAKAVTTSMGSSPAGYQATGKAAQDLASGVGRTTAERATKAVEPVIVDIAKAAKAGKPFSYGEFYNRATQLNQEAHAAYKAGNKAVGAQIEGVYKGMMEDLAKVGPEAAQAAASYHNAMTGLGGPEGIKKVVKALGASGLIAGAGYLSPTSLAMTIPAAVAGLSMRIPGVGQAMARSVIGPDGVVVKSALPAVAQLVKDYVKDKNGND